MVTSPLPYQVYTLLRDHCTKTSANKKKFIEKVNSVLNGSMLRIWDHNDAWNISWDKPLYSNQNAGIASTVRETIVGDAVPAWFSSPAIIPQNADLFQGLRNPKEKYQRIMDLAGIWDAFHRENAIVSQKSLEILAESGYSDVAAIRALIGAPGYSEKDPVKLFFILQRVRGIAGITSLHILMDLGYPVCKPDRWLVRFAAADQGNRAQLIARTKIDPINITQEYLERHLDVSFHAVDILEEQCRNVAQPTEITNLGNAFLRYRFCDLMLAKFGMDREDTFGIEISGKNRILDDPKVAALYPDLLPIAQEMQNAEAEKKKQRQAVNKMKKAGKSWCKVCAGEKDLSEFPTKIDKAGKVRRGSTCIACAERAS